MMRIFKIIATIAAFIGGILFFLRPKGKDEVSVSPFEQTKKELQTEKAGLEKELDEINKSGDTNKDEIEKKYNS